jgi:uncharacterized damage-inducible protein DinB
MPDSELTVLLAIIDQAFDQKSWHGTNLRGSIRGLSAEVAAWRPAANRHNIWETVIHAAYWKYAVCRRFSPEALGSFPFKGSNWFVRPVAGVEPESLWKSDVKVLVEIHKTMREAIARLSPENLHKTPEGSKVSNLALISGIAAHDLYHAGQIQLLKRLRAA